MSNRQIAPNALQPENFTFTPENLELALGHIAKYPKDRQASAVLPLLELAQRQHRNWLPMKAVEYVADLLSMPVIRVLEVATFYTMFNLSPVGKYHLQICRSISCWLRGSEQITKTCKNKLAINLGETCKDGMFTLVEVECLGACANAPMMQINDDYYEDLDSQSMEKIIDALSQNKDAKRGSQTGRKSSEAIEN